MATLASMDGRLPPGPGPLRRMFRMALKAPASDPVRRATLEWAEARAKIGPEFAVPRDWWPSGRRWAKHRRRT